MSLGRQEPSCVGSIFPSAKWKGLHSECVLCLPSVSQTLRTAGRAPSTPWGCVRHGPCVALQGLLIFSISILKTLPAYENSWVLLDKTEFCQLSFLVANRKLRPSHCKVGQHTSHCKVGHPRKLNSIMPRDTGKRCLSAS